MKRSTQGFLVLFSLALVGAGALGFAKAKRLRLEQQHQRVLAEGTLNQVRAEAFCVAYMTLAADAGAEPSASEVDARVDPGLRTDLWGTPFEFQPWNHQVRSLGKDRLRNTTDDIVFFCARP